MQIYFFTRLVDSLDDSTSTYIMLIHHTAHFALCRDRDPMLKVIQISGICYPIKCMTLNNITPYILAEAGVPLPPPPPPPPPGPPSHQPNMLLPMLYVYNIILTGGMLCWRMMIILPSTYLRQVLLMLLFTKCLKGSIYRLYCHCSKHLN